jgi:hypothetical protein
MDDDSAFWRGATLFDRGEYFAAHEAWEVRWLVSTDSSERLLLQGLIQVAAAFHKLFVSRSSESARRLLNRGLDKLDALDSGRVEADLESAGAEHRHFDLAAFRRDIHACEPELANDQFERARVPRMVGSRQPATS